MAAVIAPSVAAATVSSGHSATRGATSWPGSRPGPAGSQPARLPYGTAHRPDHPLPPRLPSTPRLPHASVHQVFTVNSTVDSPLKTTGSTSCADQESTPKCSLRAAVGAADDDTGHVDEIVIPKGKDLVLSLGVLDLTNSMIVDGTGATVNGGGSEVFDESGSSGALLAVQITGLEITGASAGDGDGGGLYCDDGSLDLTSVTLSGDSAGEGGGAYIGFRCELWASGSTFSEDSATDDGDGGGLYVDGSADITDSTFGGASASAGDDAEYGAGMYNDGTTTVSGSTIDWNSPAPEEEGARPGAVPAATADVYGWGVGVYNDGALDVTGTDIEHNNAPDGAGGVGLDNDWVADVSGSNISHNRDVAVDGDEVGGAGVVDFGTSISLDHDTFTDDSMRLQSDGSFDSGGAIYTSSESFSLTNSSIAGSSNTAGSAYTGTLLEGGALYLDAEVANVENDTISGTTGTADEIGGGDVYVESSECCDARSRAVPRDCCGAVDPTVLEDVTIRNTHVSAPVVNGGVVKNEGGLQLTDVAVSSTTVDSAATGACSYGLSGVFGGVYDMEGGFGITGGSIAGTVASATLASSVSTPSTTATCVYGGAVYGDDGGTTSGLSITGTTATASGGDGGVLGAGWYNDDALTLRDTQIVGVTATADDYLEGGGFDNWDYLTATNFTVGDVTAKVLGGADASEPGTLGAIFYNAETADVVNGTFAASSSSTPTTGPGDSDVADGYSGDLQLTNSTIGDDSVTGPKGEVALLYVEDSDQMSLLNTIVDDPTAPSEDCLAASGGAIESEGHNVDGGTSCGFDKPGDLVDTNPLLLPLADYGGSVETEALTPPAGSAKGSPAIDAGTNAGCPATDARGVTRPQDGTCDIGAYEVAAQGYWLSAADGKVFHFGAGSYYGSAYGLPLKGPIVAIAATPDHLGYYEVGSDGGVFAFGSARFGGSLADLPLAAPIVGVATTADDDGYWLVGAEGHVYPFGDATYHGSEDYVHQHDTVVGIASTPDAGGYWLATANGHVIPFGDAKSYGEPGSTSAGAVVAIASTPNGLGYWLVTSTGHVYPYGDAKSYGSLSGSGVVAILPTPDGFGYWIVSSSGAVSRFGDAKSIGSESHPPAAVTGAASANY